jgi:predicted TIM-barrel fold metal-dependent hydrolase
MHSSELPHSNPDSVQTRREFLQSTVASSVIALGITGSTNAAPKNKVSPIIDTHMHVWASDLKRYPMPHPYDKDFQKAPHPATVEMLVDDMDKHGCTHSVLVQCIYHGWDNTYVADCLERYPKRFRGHGLIEPTDPNVADKLKLWVKGRGLHGMRFSPIYYDNGKHGGDSWLNARRTNRLWKMAADLNAVFNFFIAPTQLPKLATMVKAHPTVKVVVDHVSQIDLGQKDPEAEFKLLLEMAKYRNVWLKVSELTSVSKSGKYPFADALPYVKRIYEAFGPDRLLFGTGYPGTCRAAYDRPTLAKEIELVEKHIPFFTKDDQAKFLGRNAAELWGFV